MLLPRYAPRPTGEFFAQDTGPESDGLLLVANLKIQVALSLRDTQTGYALVSPSIDLWALGLIGLAVFTGQCTCLSANGTALLFPTFMHENASDAGKGLYDDEHTEEQVRLMLCNEEPLPFELSRSWWDHVQPPAVAGLLRNLLQRKPLLRMTVDDVLRVPFSANHKEKA